MATHDRLTIFEVMVYGAASDRNLGCNVGHETRNTFCFVQEKKPCVITPVTRFLVIDVPVLLLCWLLFSVFCFLFAAFFAFSEIRYFAFWEELSHQ